MSEKFAVWEVPVGTPGSPLEHIRVPDDYVPPEPPKEWREALEKRLAPYDARVTRETLDAIVD